MGHRRLVIEAFAFILAIRICLWTLSYNRLESLLQRFEKRKITAGNSADRIIWAVKAVSRYVPKATCLTQALAAQTLLRKYGHSATLQIGVAKTPDNKFQAHAWIEGNGRVLLGGTELGKYTPLLKCIL